MTPDIITMAKALTNGAIPMGAVAVRDAIHETITDAAPENAIEFFHGYTYSGHPAACAAGLATLRDLRGRGPLRARRRPLRLLPRRGLVAARPRRSSATSAASASSPASRSTPSPASPALRGTELQKRLFWNGCHVKWTGDTAIVAPSLVAERAHVDEIVDCLRRTLAQ